MVEVASDKQATDIVMLDVRRVLSFADYFVIMTGESRRQTQALGEDMAAEIEKAGGMLGHIEGSAESGWVLLDFHDVIVHIFGPEERSYYRLEELWSQAPQVVRIL